MKMSEAIIQFLAAYAMIGLVISVTYVTMFWNQIIAFGEMTDPELLESHGEAGLIIMLILVGALLWPLIASERG
jgi:hypothetical protein